MSICASPPGFAELVQRGGWRPSTPGESRGVKQAGFMVLTTARRPAILVEMGYSTNPEGRAFPHQPERARSPWPQSIADAVVEYLLEYKRKTGAAADSGAGR